MSTDIVIQQTQNWVEQIVIGLNLCPFASKPFHDKTINYVVNIDGSLQSHLLKLADCFADLDQSATIDTSLIIYPETYQNFDDYLDMLDYANHLLDDLKYSGTYQIASFHPAYRFHNSTEDDAANFSNRSPYPMLHLIRENSLEKALATYPDVESVPENNIKKLRAIGFKEMQERLNKITG